MTQFSLINSVQRICLGQLWNAGFHRESIVHRKKLRILPMRLKEIEFSAMKLKNETMHNSRCFICDFKLI
jgi:hypothetical protein